MERGEKISYIYCLSGKNKKDVFYIGKTESPTTRLGAHKSSAKKGVGNAKKNKKIIELGDELELNILVIIKDSIGGYQDLCAERELIKAFIYLGYRLLNANLPDDLKRVLKKMDEGGNFREGLFMVVSKHESKGDTDSVSIDSSLYEEATAYCKKKGLFIKYFVNEAVRDKLQSLKVL